jgi:hypothetical protein
MPASPLPARRPPRRLRQLAAAALALAGLSAAAAAEPLRLDPAALDRVRAGASAQAWLLVGDGPLAGGSPPPPPAVPGRVEALARRLACALAGRSCG